MGDTGDDYRAHREYIKEQKAKLGIPCPDCIKREPKRNPTILLPGQKCYCGYRDKRSSRPPEGEE